MPKSSKEAAVISVLSNKFGRVVDRRRYKYNQNGNIVYLNLSNLSISELPDELWQLTRLESLDLNNNEIRTIPADIKHLIHLRSLILRNNRLHVFPDELLELNNLERLQLSGNSLSYLPPEVCLFSNLDSLFLGRNHLSYLPIEIGLLSTLKSLYLVNNHLSKLPTEIGGLTSLQELYLSRNRLNELPPEIGSLPNLRVLEVNDNPGLLSPPPEIVASGTEAIRVYLQQLQHQTTIRYESKLLVVGEGGTGKTSLLRALHGERFQPDSNTTHGIEIGVYKLPHPTYQDVTITLHTWDFGGQQIYHATHQFFLTQRSLYLVVWNARLGAEQGRLDYWLDTIKALAPAVPVILVATHVDERAPDLHYQLYKDAYPQILGSVAISNKTGSGIDNLRIVLAEHAAQLPLMGQRLPQTWVQAEDALQNSPEHHIDVNSFRQICIAKGVNDENTQSTLGGYLHDLGKILYFQDDDILCSIVILKPNWVTKAISRVLTDDSMAVTRGILVHVELPRIWATDEYGQRYGRHLYPIFLRLMERFDLSYQLGEPGERATASLMPLALPYQPPSELPAWPETATAGEAQVEMIYRLDFVPAGVMSWFIVRTHRYTSGFQWREGVILSYEEHTARVELNPMLREIRLLCWGRLPQNFFTILMKTMDEVLKRFKGLRMERLIPCICHRRLNVAERCARYYRYEDLVRRMEAGKQQVECADTFQEVSVPELLYGIHVSTDQQVIQDIKRGQDELQADIKAQRGLMEQINQQSELIGRSLARQWNLFMKQMEAECPNTFFLMPADHRSFDPRNWTRKEYLLYLVCQHPSGPHPVGQGYTVCQSADWWLAISPWLQYLITFLKFAVPMGGKVFEAVAAKATVDEMKAGIGVLEEITKNLNDLTAAVDISQAMIQPYLGEDRQAVGPALRALYSFLTEADKSRIWGGLHHTLTPDGNILWLCAEHYKPFAVQELEL